MSFLTGVISFPIPIYQNLPIEAQYFQPSQFVISNVSLGNTTIVTTVLNTNFVIGQQVRLLIPPQFGCFQLNNRSGYVLSFPTSNQVEVSINSNVNVNAYIAGISNTNSPQIIAIGDINQGSINSNGPSQTNPGIPGAFENISPL
jgi:hypothetical protein